MPRKVWTRERLTSADVQALLMDQAVIRFASAATRTAEWPSPPDGALSYLEDAKRYDERRGGAWQPLAAGGIAGKMWRTGGVHTISGGTTGTEYVVPMEGSRVRGGFTFDDAGDALTVPLDGLYDLTWQAYLLANLASTGEVAVRRVRASTANATVGSKAYHKPLAAFDLQDQGIARDVPLKAGDKLSLVIVFQSGVTQLFGNGEVNGCLLSAQWRHTLPAGTNPL